jgi:mRNA-degrading endonuclease RelE of RelBE toxin-antitoxin system
MPTDPPLQVIASARFQRDLRLLAKRYRSIRQDVQPVLEQLQSGELPGVQVSGLGCTIFKVRLRNRDVQKGKSGGYRLIYYIKMVDQIVLITIYSKSDQGDIAAAEIQEIIAEFEQNNET